MVERFITPQAEVEGLYRKTGVVVFILNEHGQILLLQETGAHDTDGGQSGEFSTYCETTNPGENWPETIIRGLQEELGISPEQRSRFMISPNSGVLGEYKFSADVLARVTILHWAGNPDEALSLTGDGEVAVVGWVNPEEALHYQLRPGVRKILLECLEEKHLTRQTLVAPQDLVPLSIISLHQGAKILTEKKPGPNPLIPQSAGQVTVQ